MSLLQSELLKSSEYQSFSLLVWNPLFFSSGNVFLLSHRVMERHQILTFSNSQYSAHILHVYVFDNTIKMYYFSLIYLYRLKYAVYARLFFYINCHM